MEVTKRARSSGPLCAGLQIERKLIGLLSWVRERGSCLISQKVRGGPAFPDPVSIVMECRAWCSWGMPDIWTWPGTFTKPQLESRVGVGEFGVCPPSPSGPEMMPSGPYWQR